jgi:hypothetical protein
MGQDSRRDEFLKQHYAQLWNNINRHITVSWEAFGVLASAFAIFFAFGETKTSSFDFATALIIIVSAWGLGHIYDANTWFNRNLGIISNIERQFLTRKDSKEIQFYFAQDHRKPGQMLQHFSVQRDLAFAVPALVLIAHFYYRVMPGLREPWGNFDPPRACPYVAAILCSIWVCWQRKSHIVKQRTFNTRSPGIAVQDDPVRHDSP